LSQVLADGANRYLYGMGRIAQQAPCGLQYFLPDAPSTALRAGLGSARQLSDVAGVFALAQSFAPRAPVLYRRVWLDTSPRFMGGSKNKEISHVTK
jgi:hypothetical protein